MEQYLGQIQLLSFSWAPVGWALCDGTLLQISSNTALFSLVGTSYGGDGTSTFGLPNLQGKEPGPNMRYCIAVQGVYPSRP
jgi:microcystin-dependent protein